MRGATKKLDERKETFDISTHTPHAGRDLLVGNMIYKTYNFYSHAPCGARRDSGLAEWYQDDFYSHAPCGARHRELYNDNSTRKFLLTRPMRGATWKTFNDYSLVGISTHTPHAGRDGNISNLDS